MTSDSDKSENKVPSQMNTEDGLGDIIIRTRLGVECIGVVGEVAVFDGQKRHGDIGPRRKHYARRCVGPEGHVVDLGVEVSVLVVADNGDLFVESRGRDELDVHRRLASREVGDVGNIVQFLMETKKSSSSGVDNLEGYFRIGSCRFYGHDFKYAFLFLQ